MELTVKNGLDIPAVAALTVERRSARRSVFTSSCFYLRWSSSLSRWDPVRYQVWVDAE